MPRGRRRSRHLSSSGRPKGWDTPLLFTNHEGERLTASGWGQRLKKIYAPKLRLKRLSPYDLRHDAALHFLRNGMNPFPLQAIMGHSDLETTKHYIALVEADIREAQEKASPVRRLIRMARSAYLGKLSLTIYIKPYQKSSEAMGSFGQVFGTGKVKT